MRLLFVSSFALHSQTRAGGAKRLAYIVDSLCKWCHVDLICWNGSRDSLEGIEPPSSNEKLRTLYLPEPKRGANVTELVLHSLLDFRQSYSTYWSLISDFLGDRKYDAILMAFPVALSMPLKEFEPFRPLVLYLDDDLLVGGAWSRLKQNQVSLLKKTWLKWRANQMDRYYRLQMRKVDLVLSISRQEEAILNQLCPWVKSEILGYGIPLNQYPLLPSHKRPLRAGFIGNYQHNPNRDAMEHYLAHVHRPIKTAFPEYQILIAGQGIPESWIEQWAREPGVAFQSDFIDLASVYQEFGFFINPIISGKGLRTKLIEAAAFGRPIISTALGAEGLEELIIYQAESPDDYLAAIRKILALDRNDYDQVISSNRQIVETTFSIEAIGERLRRVINEGLTRKRSEESTRPVT